MKLSLVVPCYNEQGNVEMFYEVVKNNYKNIKHYELIFVNDGSKDNTFGELKKIAEKDKNHVKVLSFSRNFGKEAAMLSGLKEASGEYIGIIDADMQQDPMLILEMLDILEKDDSYDVVSTYQEQKNLSFFQRKFYSIIDKMSQVDFKNGASDFRLFRKYVVDAILTLEEQNRFSKGIFSYVGYNTYYLPYVPNERNAGVTSFSFKRLLNYAISGIISFSTIPLKLPLYLGILFLVTSLITLIIFLINLKMILGIVSLILFVSSVNFLVMGVICEYLSQMHIESKKRPMYIVKDKLNIK